MRSIDPLLSLLVLGGVAVLSLGSGCATTAIGEGTPLEAEFSEAPEWVVKGCAAYWGDEDDEDARVCGVGSADGSRNTALMRTTAIGRGRTEIARSLEIRVRAMLKDYASTTTGGQDFGAAANDEQHIIDVSRQITKLSLSGTELTDTWISKTGTYYALVSLRVAKFAHAVNSMDQLSERTRRAVVERAEKEWLDLDDNT